MNNDKQIWIKCLDLLEKEMTELSFNTWIKSIDSFKIEGSKAIFEVSEPFYREQLKSRYFGLIQNAIIQITNKKYELDFLLPSEIENTSIEAKEFNNKVDIVPFLNPKYTFDSFVIGGGNEFAHAASLAVAESPGTAYNPLFIYGGVGLGKTHLMHAIGHYILSQNKNQKILYATSEKFTNELIDAIKEDKNEQFRAKYRKIDILLIDDIQFIAGKERTQEEFFHTFNTLYESQKQIIVTSDRPPSEIQRLEERLRSRFEWGLLADIQAPDFETRIAILQKKSQQEQFLIPNDVLVFIAENIASNIRELEGALNRIVAFSSISNAEINIDLAQKCLKQIIKKSRSENINFNTIQKVVSRYFNINPDQMISKKRSRDITFPRQIAMYLCRELTEMSLHQIGQAFGGRDHTTVMHACDKISEEISVSAETRKSVREINKNITGK